MKKRKPFKDFDSFYDKIYLAKVEGYTFEIWHQRGKQREEIEAIAKNIFDRIKKDGKGLPDSLRYDFRP
jgi:hypothetical protein